ncbi:hypothetical protein [Catellatospora sp. NPDC049609]|uniref:hypothetical protein n=1 Tax=Catellatospora sp. NPDC049609 TaxID=3155505 RepID=UPI00341A33FB
MRGERIGAIIGSIGGLVFILINAGQLAAPLSTVVRVAGALGFAAVVWFAVIRPGAPAAPAGPPTGRAIRIYWAAVAAMVVAIPAGAALLNNVLDRPALTPLWVVFVVGAHFLPFAGAFEAPVFARLAWTMMGLAAAGAVLGVLVTASAVAWAGVLAGAALLAFSAAGSMRRPVAVPAP